MVVSTMNLISGTHNLCEKMEYAFIVLWEYTIIFPNNMAKVCRNVKIFYVIQNKLVSCQEKRTVWTIIWYTYYLDKFSLDVIYIYMGPQEKIMAAFGTLFCFELNILKTLLMSSPNQYKRNKKSDDSLSINKYMTTCTW